MLRLALSMDAEDQELLALTLADEPNALLHAIGYGLLTAELKPRMRGLVGSTA